MLGLLITLLLAGSDQGVVLRPKAEVAAETVTLADLVDMSRLPPTLHGPAGEAVLARLAPGEAIELSYSHIAERARARAPAFAAWLKPGVDVVRVQRSAAPSVPVASSSPPCARLAHSVDGGDFLVASDLVEAVCGEPILASATWFDRSAGVVRAARPLPEGAVIAAPPASTLAQFEPGQAFTVSATYGPVRVERPVQAVRPAAAGDPVAVQDEEGRVLVLPATTEGGS